MHNLKYFIAFTLLPLSAIIFATYKCSHTVLPNNISDITVVRNLNTPQNFDATPSESVNRKADYQSKPKSDLRSATEVRLLSLIPNVAQFKLDSEDEAIKCDRDQCSVILRQRRDGSREEYSRFMEIIQSGDFAQTMRENGFEISSMSFGSKERHVDSYAELYISLVKPNADSRLAQ